VKTSTSEGKLQGRGSAGRLRGGAGSARDPARRKPTVRGGACQQPCLQPLRAMELETAAKLASLARKAGLSSAATSRLFERAGIDSRGEPGKSLQPAGEGPATTPAKDAVPPRKRAASSQLQKPGGAQPPQPGPKDPRPASAHACPARNTQAEACQGGWQSSRRHHRL
jgi:hypothetical protein